MPQPSFSDLYAEGEADDLKDAVRSALRPLIDRLNTETERLNQLQREIEEVRSRRSVLTKTIRAIDKDAAPSLYRKTPKRAQPSNVAHKKRLDDLTEWLQAHRDELNGNGGFRRSDLLAHKDFTITRQGKSLTRYLAELHDLGVLHLDRFVRGASGGGHKAGKFYKVV